MEDEDETINEKNGNQIYDEMNQNILEDIFHKQPTIKDNNDVIDNNSEDDTIENSGKEDPDSEEDGSNPVEESQEDTIHDEAVRNITGRISRPPTRMNLNQCYLLTQTHEKQEYSAETENVIARHIIGYNNKQHHQFIATFSLNKGIKQFGSKGYEATMAGIKQLHV